MSTDTETMNAYRDRAADYQSLVADLQDPNLDRFIHTMPKQGEVLDAGAGPGHHALVMQQAGLSVTALEPMAEFCEMIRANGVPVICDSFDAITQSRQFDGIWASFSLLHATREDFQRYLQAMHKALKNGGTLLIGMKTGRDAKRDRLGRYYSYYTLAELACRLEAVGQRVVHFHTGSAEGLAGDREPFVFIQSEKSV